MPGEANHYLSVDTVGADRVQVTSSTELSYFSEGDKVLLIQMTGALMPATFDFLTNLTRYIDDFRHAGSYEILQVDHIITGTKNIVVFTDNVTNVYDYGEKIQLVRLVQGDNVTVKGNITAKPWDGSTGGIIAILGMDTVKLQANIDAGGAGFRGGIVPAENYMGSCRSDGSDGTDTLHFPATALHRAGNKGEGIITVNPALWNYTKGAGAAVNGGGGGNGMFSGGAGGGNYWQGGDGGPQSFSCTGAPTSLVLACGGLYCNRIYNDYNGVIMGGGGGTGVKNLPVYTATNGGNGGGIVIIITSVLQGKAGSTISAMGITVTGSATGSGGGGGGAGTVMIDATSYSGSFNINLRGGSGGATNGSVCTGSGGGGAGGLFWYAGSAISGATVNFDSTKGSRGNTGACGSVTARSGNVGLSMNQLMLNLSGFLFNALRGTDTICAGQIPGKITGTRPKGGNGIYTWAWEQSTDKLNWIPAIGTFSRDSIRPVALNQTTYYRRVVESYDKNYDLISDTSKELEIFVYPSIGNNIISGRDTICYNLEPKPLTGTNPTGGNSVYNYNWQSSADSSSWTAGGNLSSWSPGPLQRNTYFRRVVTSTAYCSHTSNTLLVTVLPSITHNEFETADTVICQDLGPGPLNAKNPANGDGLYAYQWQSRFTSGNWTDIPGSNQQRYNPGNLSDTTLYRRIVFSGNDKACRDTSAIKTIHVLPLITGNILSSDSIRYCNGDVPLKISGAQPSGGNLLYTYQWYSSGSGIWQQMSGENQRDYMPSQPADTTLLFKREVISGTYTVSSGSYHACRDTSPVLKLVVVPVIVNDIIAAGQTICQENTPSPLNAAAASGGFGGFTYEWLQKEENSTWMTAPGIHDQEDYVPQALNITTLFARKAYSDICTDTSNAVNILVYPSISNNSVPGGAVQYTCFNTGKSMSGSQPSHGSGSYAYAWIESDNSTDWTATSGNLSGYTSNPLASAKYFRRIVYSSPQSHECVDTSNMVEVRINSLPTGDIIAQKDTVCEGTPVNVRFSVSGQHPPFIVSIGGQQSIPVSGPLDSMDLTPVASRSYVMESITDDSTCSADASGFSAEVMTVVYDVPTANAGSDDKVCGESYTLQATPSVAGSTGAWTSPGASFTDATDPHSGTVSGTYGPRQYTWTETNWKCTDDARINIIFYEQPGIPEAGADQTLDFIYTTTLEGSTPTAGTGQWTVTTGSGIFDNDTLPGAQVSELDNATTLKWTVKNGTCPEVSDEMKITIDPLNIPKAFSPDGNNMNDLFDLGAVHAESVKLKIYNATGVLVFESDDYLEGGLWDGHNLNGIELPEGTYYYVADIKVAGREKKFQFRSFVEIIR